jgi:4'-phosphopantetheinyl transferase
MESVLLDTPSGIGARLGWDPKVTEHDRKRILARQLIAAKLGVEERAVLIQREAPAQFGFHTQLFAEVGEKEVPLEIRTASFRAATVAAIAEPGVRLGIDIRDSHPDEATIAEMKRHSHLFEMNDLSSLIAHWTKVQAVRAADGRGIRMKPEYVRLDLSRHKGWIPDRPVHYSLLDLSRDGWIITLAYENEI